MPLENGFADEPGLDEVSSENGESSDSANSDEAGSEWSLDSEKDCSIYANNMIYYMYS